MTLGMSPALPLSSSGRRAGGPTSSLAAAAALVFAKPIYILPGVVLGTVSLLIWSRTALDDTSIRMVEDANLVRFSDSCAAPVDGVEGALPQSSGDVPILRDVVVLFVHGDSTPVLDWPGPGEERPLAWDCTPQALPRYWKRNQRLRFAVVGPDGSRLERSFDPDLLLDADSGGGPGGAAAAHHHGHPRCAAGQLTPEGFRQMAALGRHLAQAYGDHLSSAQKLHVESLDLKRALASTVGVLMTMLTTPKAHEQFRDDSEVLIHTRGNATVAQGLLDPQRLPALLDPAPDPDPPGKPPAAAPDPPDLATTVGLGDHLLSRWCHQMPWPCRNKGKAKTEECVSVESAAALVARGEKGMCELLRQPGELEQELLEHVAQLSSGDEGRSLSLLSVDGRTLAGAFSALLGGEALCKDSQALRPAFGSRLVLERWWDTTDAFRWRVAWNGADVTDLVEGCAAKFPPGCEDKAFQRALLRPIAMPAQGPA